VVLSPDLQGSSHNIPYTSTVNSVLSWFGKPFGAATPVVKRIVKERLALPEEERSVSYRPIGAKFAKLITFEEQPLVVDFDAGPWRGARSVPDIRGFSVNQGCCARYNYYGTLRSRLLCSHPRCTDFPLMLILLELWTRSLSLSRASRVH
jgi:hypothetical protein